MRISARVVLILVLLLLASVGAARLHWYELPVSVPVTQMANLLAPLLLVAAFIERAVEVIISPMRDAGAAVLRKNLNTAELVDPPDSAVVALANAALVAYRAKTKSYAFTATLLLGLVAAFAGIRCLGVFLPPVLPPSIPAGQLSFFRVLDVLLTAALLAGGANGLHAPINAFTTFFNASANGSQNAQTKP